MKPYEHWQIRVFPPRAGRYLVTFEDGGGARNVGIASFIAPRNRHGREYWSADAGVNVRVVAWAEMPEPYPGPAESIGVCVPFGG